MGYVKSAHGIRGEVFAQIPSGEWDWATVGLTMWLRPRNSEESAQAFEIERFRSHKTGLIIKFKEVLDRNQAESLQGHVVLVEEEHFVSEPGENIYLHEVLGFQVFDKEQEVGEVIGFMDNGAQDLLRVRDEKAKEKEHLIPFLEIFVESIDFENKRIHMDLPEGLME